MAAVRTLALVSGLVILSVGCGSSGPALANLKGVVKFKGEPLKVGGVYLSGDNGRYESAIRGDGSYEFLDVTPGSYTVTINNEAWNPEQKVAAYNSGTAKSYQKGTNDMYAKMAQAAGKTAAEEPQEKDKPAALSPEKKAELAKVFVKLPPRYRDAKNSPLSIKLTDGPNVRDLDLID